LFSAAIKSVLETLGIVTWDGAMTIVESFVWMEQLYGERGGKLMFEAIGP
jgi:hypothetical protein